MKKDLIYKLVLFLIALAIAVGNYFNLKAEAGGWGIVGMDVVIALITFCFIEGGFTVATEKKRYSWKVVLVSVGVSVLITSLCLLL